MTTDLTRKTINLTGRAADALARTADRMQENTTDSINAAILLRDWVTELSRQGGSLLVQDGQTGETIRVVIL